MGKRAQDRIGQTINHLKVLDYKREGRRTLLYCECLLCSTKKWIRSDCVTSGTTISCGCYNATKNYVRPKNIKGQRFGRLTAVEPTENKAENGSIIWRCACDCNETVFVSVCDLEEQRVRSCGCLAAEIQHENGKRVGEYSVINHVVDGTNIKNLTAKIPKNNTSGHKGVTWDKARRKWYAQIEFKGKNHYLGRYSLLEDAVAAREAAEKLTFEQFLSEHNIPITQKDETGN